MIVRKVYWLLRILCRINIVYILTIHFTVKFAIVIAFKLVHSLPIGEVARCVVVCFFAKWPRHHILGVPEVQVVVVVVFGVLCVETDVRLFRVFNVCVTVTCARAEGVVARGGLRSLPVVGQLVMGHVLVDVEPRPLGVVVVAAGVVVVRLLVVALLAEFLLLAFRRRHFGGVLFPPFCSSVLKPDLWKKRRF